MFGLQSIRAYFPLFTWWGGRRMTPIQMSIFLVATFGSILLAPWGLRLLGGRITLALAIGGLILLRTLIQIVEHPLVNLIMAAMAVALLGWLTYLCCQGTYNRPAKGAIPNLVLALPLAIGLDTAIRTLLWSYDLVWHRTASTRLVTLLLAIIAVALLWGEVRSQKYAFSLGALHYPAWLPIELGLWFYLALNLTQNPAALSAATGLTDIPAHLLVNTLNLAGVLLCIVTASEVGGRLTAIGTGITLVLGIIFLKYQMGPAWLWFVLISLASWTILGWSLSGVTDISHALINPKWSAWAVSAGFLIFLGGSLYEWYLDIPQMHIVIAAALVLISVWTTRHYLLPCTPNLKSLVLISIPPLSLALLMVLIWGIEAHSSRLTPSWPRANHLRIMTYNIHQGLNAADQVDLPNIAEAIAKQHPDVVALNEVNRAQCSNGYLDTLLFLSHYLKMPYVFGPNWRDGQYGNAILSRYPILDSSNYHYTHNSTEIRGVLQVTIQTPTGPITFYATHLDHIEGPNNVRLAQVNELLHLWDERPRSIILGDMNARPKTREIQQIITSGFLDAWTIGGSPDTSTTWHARTTNRIDYIFFTPDLHLRRVWVPQTRASDHLPVLAEFES